MLHQCPPAGTPAVSADEVSDVYFIYINLKRGKLISPFASSIFLSLPPHMGSLSKKSQSSKVGGFIQMLLAGKKDGNSGGGNRTSGNLFFCRKIRLET